jgi:thiamine monophosphate kinase
MVGLELLKRIGYPVRIEDGELPEIDIPEMHLQCVLERLLMPDVRALEKTEGITAMIDISDGLFIDLHRLCASSGVGARIYEECLPVSDALKEVSDFLVLDPYPFITSGGEDYVVLFTAPQGKKEYHQIGEVIPGSDVTIVRSSGKIETVQYRGYQHFVDKG